MTAPVIVRSNSRYIQFRLQGPLQHQADWIIDRLPAGSVVRMTADRSWLIEREHGSVIVHVGPRQSRGSLV